MNKIKTGLLLLSVIIAIGFLVRVITKDNTDKNDEVISGGYEFATTTIATSTGFYENLPKELDGK